MKGASSSGHCTCINDLPVAKNPAGPANRRMLTRLYQQVTSPVVADSLPPAHSFSWWWGAGSGDGGKIVSLGALVTVRGRTQNLSVSREGSLE